MFAQVVAKPIAAVKLLREAVEELEPRCLGGDDATGMLKLFAEAERLAGAGKALAARRVEETNAWRGGGHRSAADFLAATTGSSVGAAVGTLETARRSGSCHQPQVDTGKPARRADRAREGNRGI